MRIIKRTLRGSFLALAASFMVLQAAGFMQLSAPFQQAAYADTQLLTTDTVDASGSSWKAAYYTPAVGGTHTFRHIKDTSSAVTGNEVRTVVGDNWITSNAPATGTLQLMTAELTAGVEYRIAFWATNGATSYDLEVDAPEPPSSTVTETITEGIRDDDQVLGPRYVNSFWTAPVSGQVDFELTWTNNGSLRYSIRENATNVWIADSPLNGTAPQNDTVQVTAGTEYRVSVWATSGWGDQTMTVTYDAPTTSTIATETISEGIRDDDNVLGSRWTEEFWTAPATGDADFDLIWTNNGSLRYSIRELATNHWLADSPAGGTSPQTDTLQVTEGTTYKIAVWATSGWGDHTMTVTYEADAINNGEPSRQVFTGRNDATAATAPVTTANTFNVPGNGTVYISLNYKQSNGELHLFLKDASGTQVASTEQVWVAKGIEQSIIEGDYSIEVTAVNGADDWHMEVYYEPTVLVEQTADPGSPNIVVINTDDQRADSLQDLPKITNWFGNGGVTFDNGFVTTPSCCPSRAGLFSGQFNHNNGVLGQRVPELDQNETVQRKLKDAGYNTAFAGKFVHYWPQQLTAPHWDNWTYFKGGYYNSWIQEDGVNAQFPGNSTIKVFDKGIEYVDGFKAEDDNKPWFLHLTPVAPHKPSVPEPQYENAPVLPRIQTPNIDEADRSDKPQFVRNRTKTAAAMEPLRLDMTRTLYTLDDQVDRLMTHLQNTGELSNTLIILTSDNGYHWGEHKLDEKFTPYDVSVRVPFLVFWQGEVTPGSTDSRWVSNIDIAPTVLAAAGLPIPAETDGVDIFSGYDRDWRYMEYFRDEANSSNIPGWRSIRNDNFVYTEYLAPDEVTVEFQEYYDLQDDPYMLVNLLADGNPNNDPSLTQAQTKLNEYKNCSGATCRP